MSKLAVFVVLVGFALAGCTTIGPQSVSRDRFDYNKAISDSWKEQTLLNIVKLRYADMPLFVEVASIVSGYTVEGTVGLEGTVFESGSAPATATFGGSGKFVDRPTITYVPITGSEFNQNFMTPVPPSAVLFLLQAGWPASLVLPMTVEGINGLRAQRSQGLRQRAGDKDFYRVIELFSILQDAGAMSMRLVGGAGQSESTVILIRRERIAPEIQAVADELARLLGIRSDAPKFTVTYVEIAANDTELAMLDLTLKARRDVARVYSNVAVMDREVGELLSVFPEDQRTSAEEVLRELIEARLLTGYREHDDDEHPTRRVEIVHESLITTWPRLVRWQTQDADSARLRDELRQAARLWADHERANDYLWTGKAFRELSVWRENYPGGLTDLEEAFASAMTSLATRRRSVKIPSMYSEHPVTITVSEMYSNLVYLCASPNHCVWPDDST